MFQLKWQVYKWFDKGFCWIRNVTSSVLENKYTVEVVVSVVEVHKLCNIEAKILGGCPSDWTRSAPLQKKQPENFIWSKAWCIKCSRNHKFYDVVSRAPSRGQITLTQSIAKLPKMDSHTPKINLNLKQSVYIEYTSLLITIVLVRSAHTPPLAGLVRRICTCYYMHK